MDEQRDLGPEPDDSANADEGAHVDVIALVLGHVDPQRRTVMARHLLACATCRGEYHEMTATVSELLPFVPAVQPPLGFDQQVLGRLGVEPASRPASAFKRRVIGVAAALLLTAGAVALWATNGNDSHPIGEVAPLELVNGGRHVGTVSIGEVEGETVMVVALVAAPDDVSYLCRTTFADGTTTDSEAWPAGNGAWIVPVPEAAMNDVVSVDIVVDGSDHVWSTASFRDSDA